MLIDPNTGILNQEESALLKPEEREEAVVRYLAGENSVELSAVYGITPGAIRRLVRRRGHATRPNAKLDGPAVDELCRRYLAGEDSVQLAEAFGMGSRGVIWRLKSRGIVPRTGKVLNPSQMAEVCRRYQGGESSTTLSEEFELTAGAITRLLDRRGIVRRTQQECRRVYECNHRFFETIDTEEKAYWLGFLAADGNVGDTGMVRLDLAIRDEEHLMRFRHAVGSNHPVRVRRRDRSVTTSVGMSSHPMCKDLSAHGVVPRKTHVLRWPSLGPAEVVPFIRGYVDGDGCFGRCVTGRGREMTYFSVTSTAGFLQRLQLELVERLNISKTKLVPVKPGSSVYTFSNTARLHVMAVAHLLYDGATIYLPRKKEVMLA